MAGWRPWAGWNCWLTNEFDMAMLLDCQVAKKKHLEIRYSQSRRCELTATARQLVTVDWLPSLENWGKGFSAEKEKSPNPGTQFGSIDLAGLFWFFQAPSFAT
jgi:hypothetical protein